MTASPGMSDREKTAHDQLVIRCPRLGGQVTFGYCRREAGDLPCHRTILCWQGRFPVEAFLKSMLQKEDWERWKGEGPKAKMVTLLELIEAAKVRQQGEVDLTRDHEGKET